MSITTWLASLSRARRRLYRNTMRCPNRGALVRRSLFEPLEERRLLASDWHNALVSTDVNNDRNISPLDALLVINKLNVDGSKPLPQLSPGAKPTAYYDTSGDGVLTPLDALKVINSLNANRQGNQLINLEALSNHYVKATFAGPVADALMFPESFLLTGPSSRRLEVFQVTPGLVANEVVLTTGTNSA